METKADGIYLRWPALKREEVFEFGEHGIDGAAYRAGQTLMAWVIFQAKNYISSAARLTE